MNDIPQGHYTLDREQHTHTNLGEKNEIVGITHSWTQLSTHIHTAENVGLQEFSKESLKSSKIK